VEGEAADGVEAVHHVEKTAPAVVLLLVVADRVRGAQRRAALNAERRPLDAQVRQPSSRCQLKAALNSS
jgi:hypothetical protein